MDVTPSIRRFFLATTGKLDARRRGGQGTAMFKSFLFCALLLAAAPAFAAQECGSDLQALAGRREAALKNINALVGSSHGKKLDPEAFCARSAPLTSAEDAMLAYMVKNKDWCQI